MNRPLRDRLRAALPPLITERAPRDQRETEAAARRRRRVVAGTALAGAGLLGASLSTRPNSRAFYGLTLTTAVTWTVGSLASGRLHRGVMPAQHRLRRPIVVPVLTGVGAFALFYGAALVSLRIPPLARAITAVLRYAEDGSAPLVLITTLANGAAEEVFFRGALYTAVDSHRPVVTSTAVYMLATTATRNPSLMLASVVMGTLFGLQRRASGGIEAPILTHLTWSTLMLRYLPPLFRDQLPDQLENQLEPANSPSAVSKRSTSAEST